MRPVTLVRNLAPVALLGLLGGALLAADARLPVPWFMPAGTSAYRFCAAILFVFAGAEALTFLSGVYLSMRGKPAVEGKMLGRVFRLLALLAAGLATAAGFNELVAVGSFLTLFGGMMLGWSLQAPVSGLAAWLLIQVKRPIRPGDRVQFPALDLTGDVQDLGTMYLTLNQVGGSIASEEAIGRNILPGRDGGED